MKLESNIRECMEAVAPMKIISLKKKKAAWKSTNFILRYTITNTQKRPAMIINSINLKYDYE